MYEIETASSFLGADFKKKKKKTERESGMCGMERKYTT
jgi:hypothetical protein